ncbi:MAG TPA: cyclopropane-fatty-acyl-phospholipid synthase family protein [Stellaceae bacterium]|nr:cyclopropane-fatty-acyl-phospholipid synthase family protein [Stellaceae bacterium]
MTRASFTPDPIAQGAVLVAERRQAAPSGFAAFEGASSYAHPYDAQPEISAGAEPASEQLERRTSAPKPARRLGERWNLWLLLGLLRQIIRVGSLTIIDPAGESHTVGRGEPSVTVRISRWRTAQRIALNPDMAFGEAFMDGTLRVEKGDVAGLLDLCLKNLALQKGHWIQRIRQKVRHALRRIAQHNPVAVARANVAHHYDLSDRLYELFLDADKQYSCAYFRSPDDPLEVAQAQKKRHIAEKLLLRAGQTVLDIGSGWGGLALYLAEHAGVDVTGITLSTRQHDYAAKRAAESGVPERVRFHLQDYRHATNTYDRIVSVGMFEHVGVGHYREYFRKIASLLTDEGVALVHTIGAADGPGAAHPWIERYIFPGGYTPALSEIVPMIEQAGLCITDIEVLRLHYAETLKAWRQRFMANRHKLEPVYDDRFCRMWEFYLAGCEAGFRHSGLVVFQIQLAKRIDAVPITRDYLTRSSCRSGASDLGEIPVHSMTPQPTEFSSSSPDPAAVGLDPTQCPSGYPGHH